MVQDMFTSTETARRAHLILPAAGWGEKEGTFINSERRIGHAEESRPHSGKGARGFPHLPIGGAGRGVAASSLRGGIRPRKSFKFSKKSAAVSPATLGALMITR